MKRNISKDLAQLVWLSAAIAVMVLASSVELLDHPPRNLPKAKPPPQPVAGFNVVTPSPTENLHPGPDAIYAQPGTRGNVMQP